MLRQRLAEVTAEISSAAMRAGRDPRPVRLVAVTKTLPASLLQAALTAGMREFGENYLQEAVQNFSELHWQLAAEGTAPATRHVIVHLQSNKARQAVQWFDLIQTIDSESLARRVDRIAGELGRVAPVLLEVNISGDEKKTGFFSQELEGVFHSLTNLAHIQIQGLMTIGRYTPDPAAARGDFRQLRELRDRLAESSGAASLPELSMGMSHDFAIAVEEGATIVRVGTRIFGPRR